jgi:hypothetical protein
MTSTSMKLQDILNDVSERLEENWRVEMFKKYVQICLGAILRQRISSLMNLFHRLERFRRTSATFRKRTRVIRSSRVRKTICKRSNSNSVTEEANFLSRCDVQKSNLTTRRIGLVSLLMALV